MSISNLGGINTNKLVNELPSKLKIGDKIYKINTSSRANLLTIQAFEDAHAGELVAIEAWEIFFENIFEDEIPPQEDWIESFEKWQRFLSQCREDNKNEPSTIDFTQDSNLIYDALYSSGISEEEIKTMHFWNLISRLTEVKDTKFNRVVHLRLQYKKGKLTKEERKEINDVWGWDTIKIKQKLSVEEKAEQDYFENIMAKFGF